jgi:hypothetical protein
MVNRHRKHSSVDAVEEGAHPHLRRLVPQEVAEQEVEPQAGVDHVLHEEHLAAGHVEPDVTGETDPAAVGSECAERQKVDLQAAIDRTDQVSQEGKAAAQHADDDSVVIEELGNLHTETMHASSQVVGTEQ